MKNPYESDSVLNEDIHKLNSIYSILSPVQRLQLFYNQFKAFQILVSSSFGTTAPLLLHMISKISPHQEVVFIDTGFHFPETLAYKNLLAEKFNLNIRNIRPSAEVSAYTQEHKLWENNPEECTRLNKIEPFERIKKNYDFWISGVMACQTPHRAELSIFERKGNIIKFHPLIDFTEAQKNEYFHQHQLPIHPMEPKGYESIGCIHCTVKGKNREGRFFENEKKECGLHL